MSLRLQHRIDDAGIGAAAAEIAAHAFADAFGIVAGLRLAHHADGAHDLAGRAEAALKTVMGDEGGLHGMQLVAARDAFDGEDVGTVVADGEREAGIDALAVDEDGAGAALTAVASLLGSGQIEALTQEIEQRDAWIVEDEIAPRTVHGEADGVVHTRLRSDMDMSHRAARHLRGRRRYRAARTRCGPTLERRYGGILRLTRVARKYLEFVKSPCATNAMRPFWVRRGFNLTNS